MYDGSCCCDWLYTPTQAELSNKIVEDLHMFFKVHTLDRWVSALGHDMLNSSDYKKLKIL